MLIIVKLASMHEEIREFLLLSLQFSLNFVGLINVHYRFII